MHTHSYDISRFIGELNIWQVVFDVIFNLVKSSGCYTCNSYKTMLVLFKFGGWMQNRHTTKLKPLPN